MRFTTEYLEDCRKDRWNEHAYGMQRHRPTAQESEWKFSVRAIHKGLSKAESSMATLLRTEKIGLNQFLYQRRVPGVVSPACECGWHKQTTKHVIIHCPTYAQGRAQMYHEAGTSQYREILTTSKGVRVVTRWAIRSGILQMFRLARELLSPRGGQFEEEGLQHVAAECGNANAVIYSNVRCKMPRRRYRKVQQRAAIGRRRSGESRR